MKKKLKNILFFLGGIMALLVFEFFLPNKKEKELIPTIRKKEFSEIQKVFKQKFKARQDTIIIKSGDNIWKRFEIKTQKEAIVFAQRNNLKFFFQDKKLIVLIYPGDVFIRKWVLTKRE